MYPSRMICQLVDCCFSGLQHKNPSKLAGLVQGGHHRIITFSGHDINEIFLTWHWTTIKSCHKKVDQ